MIQQSDQRQSDLALERRDRGVGAEGIGLREPVIERSLTKHAESLQALDRDQAPRPCAARGVDQFVDHELTGSLSSVHPL